ncbi:MAG: hypothetical protein Q8L48_04215 [Archangium sp.]|nr:hypothetical protein [Archangium sp.]
MLTSMALLILCAGPVKLAASGFAVNGEDTARASVWLERFAEVLRRDKRVEVTTTADLAQLIGLERQKQMLGCEPDATSCLAELANALGTDGVLVGSIIRTGDSFLVVVKVIRQKTGGVWWSASGRMTGEGALLDWLDAQAAVAVNAMLPPPPVPVGPLVVGGLGIVALGVGATLVALSNTVALEAVRTAPDEPALAKALDAGRTQGTAGVIVLGVGGAALATSIVWLIARGEPAATVALSPVPGGGVWASVGGRW